MITKETFKPSGGDVQSKETKTERAGYMPARVQVQRLIQAGSALSQYRKELYDFQPGEKEDPNYEDPTRGPNYDLADAHEAMKDLAKRRKKKQEAVVEVKEKVEEEKPVVVNPQK